MKNTAKRNKRRPSATPFGTRLEHAMGARGITREEMARLTFRTPQAVSQWFLRASLPVDMVAALADRLGVRAAWLAFGEGDSGLEEAQP